MVNISYILQISDGICSFVCPKHIAHSGNSDLIIRRHRTVMHGNSISDYKRSVERGGSEDTKVGVPTSVVVSKPLRTYDRKRKVKIEIKTEPQF